MTSQEIFQSIVNDISIINKKNQYFYNDGFKDLYGIFFIEKTLPPDKRALVYKDLIVSLLDFLIYERDKFILKYDSLTINSDEYHRETKYLSNYSHFLEFLIPRASKKMNENEVFKIVEFATNKNIISYLNTYNNEISKIELNSSFIYIGHILKLLREFQRENTFSDTLQNKVKLLNNDSNIIAFDSQKKELDIILKNEPFPEKEISDKKTIISVDLQTDKKWKWLQDHKLSFIENKTEFYELISDLSQINYFDTFEVSDKSYATIQKIKSNDFEAFILDIHALTNEDAGKRSAWFIGDKVIAYQIFVWMLFELKTPNVYSISTKIAEKCFTKIPSVGPISRKLGDVILKLLCETQTIEGLGTLLKLKSRNKYPVFLEELDKSITKAVRYSKLNPNDVEDYFISDYGLIGGILERAFGEYKSKLKINDYDDIEVIWSKSENILKSEPSAVKTNFGNELKVWKSTVNDIKKEFSGQKLRFESFWKKKKSWSGEVWKKYFFDHQLLGFLTRKLIWRFETDGELKNGYFLNGQFVDFQNNQIQNIENTTVTLWHPALSNVEEVQAWRSFMLSNEIKQPFKQAYREVYIVTGAEINTSTFSNRFNNHVIRHFKFVALAQQRLWHYSQSNVYSREDNPKITYSDYDIKCIFDLESEYDFATTGRIHFWDTENNVALKMEDIPTLIFSETMRDADLFVGVCSIGAEEQWENQRFREYWTGYSTSDLSETAQTRKSVIQSIIAKLKIKDRCEVADKYLKVTGKKRIYKIHFGSGNILMEPNDEYLCIIPDPKAAIKDKLFLPFDGDATLSIIISKALLLADDDKITDSVILNQINRK